MSIFAGNRIFLVTLQTPKACDSYRLLKISVAEICLTYRIRILLGVLYTTKGNSEHIYSGVHWLSINLCCGNHTALVTFAVNPALLPIRCHCLIWFFCLHISCQTQNMHFDFAFQLGKLLIYHPPTQTASYAMLNFKKFHKCYKTTKNYEKKFEINEACIMLLS